MTHSVFSYSRIYHVGVAAQFSNVVQISSPAISAMLDRLNDPNRSRVTIGVRKASRCL